MARRLATLLLLAAGAVAIEDGCTTIGVGPKALVEGGTVVTHTADCFECDWRLARVNAPEDATAPFVARKYRPRYPVEVSDRAATWSRGNLEYATLDVDAGAAPFEDAAIGAAQEAAWASQAWDDDTISDVVPYADLAALGDGGQYSSMESLFGIANDAGLAMGESTCEAVFPGLKPRASPGAAGPGVDVSQLTRVALRFCATARCAIRLMGAVAESRGYYAADDVAPGERGEALTIGDGDEAWMFHILPDDTGLSAIWAAARIPEGHVSVSANAFVLRGIPDAAFERSGRDACLAGGADCAYAASTNLRRIAEASGYLVERGGAVDFAATYGPRDVAGDSYIYSTRRVWRVFSIVAPLATAASIAGTPMDYLGSELPWAIEVEDPNFSVAAVLALNRDHYEGSRFDMTKGLAAGPWGDPTRYDLTFVDSPGAYGPAVDALPTLRQAADLGRFERAISMFRTTYSFASHSPPAKTRGALPVLWFGQGAPHACAYSPLVLAAPVEDAPTELAVGNLFQVHASSLWWATTKVANWIRVGGYAFAIEDVKAAQEALEAELGAAAKAATPATAAAVNAAAAAKAHDAWTRLFDKLVCKYRDGFALAKSDVDVAVKKTFYPVEYLDAVGFFSPKHGYYADDGDRPFPAEEAGGEEDLAEEDLKLPRGVRAPLVLDDPSAPARPLSVDWLAVPLSVFGLASAAFAGSLYGRAVERRRLLD